MELIEVLFIFGATLSILSQLFLIYGYLKIKGMKKHPEKLIFWQNFSQMVLNLHWLTGVGEIFKYVSPYCQEIGAVTIYFYYLCCNVILFLSIEIAIKLKNPLNCNYKKRLIIYRVLSQVICITCFCLAIFSHNNNGKSIYGTCLVQHNTGLDLLIFVPFIIHSPICLILSFYTFWHTFGKKKVQNLRYHNYVVIVFSICWGIGALFHAFAYYNIQETHIELIIAMVVLGAPSGFYLFLARISQKGLFLKIFRRLIKKKKRLDPKLQLMKFPFLGNSSVNSSLEDSIFLFSTFEKLTIEAAIDILSGFTKFFSYCLHTYKVENENFKMNFKLSQNKNISIHSLHSSYFKKIMDISDIDYTKLLESFDICNNLIGLESRCKSIGGKSGAFFYFSHNKEFIIKSINKNEEKVLSSIIEGYYERIINPPYCLLVRIFGVFKVKINKSGSRILIIMENLMKNFENPLIFDLKGSTHERFTSDKKYSQFSSMPRNVVYKDIDFLNLNEYEKDFKECDKLFMSLEYDSKLLESNDIMDYSLLLILEEFEYSKNKAESHNFFKVGKYWCSVAIIDFFQNYTRLKKFETNFNRLKKNDLNRHSCIPPKAYRDRFLELMRKIFVMTSCRSTILDEKKIY